MGLTTRRVGECVRPDREPAIAIGAGRVGVGLTTGRFGERASHSLSASLSHWGRPRERGPDYRTYRLTRGPWLKGSRCAIGGRAREHGPGYLKIGSRAIRNR